MAEVFEREDLSLNYKVGTMIEIPRACVVADKIAEGAEFFSFGTNDLTQMSFGFSRDDTGKIIKEYRDKLIFEEDPFQILDQEGVGELVKMAVEKGKSTRPNIKLGICGEHVFTRDQLLDKVWGIDYPGETRTVDVHIRYLRRKLGDNDEKYIETIRGKGYRVK